MELTLTPELFTNNRFTLEYGDREALFTIVDEAFEGNHQIGRISRITILVRKISKTGKLSDARLCTTIIGMGDGVVGIKSDNPELRGKVFTKDNMEQCTVILYEDA